MFYRYKPEKHTWSYVFPPEGRRVGGIGALFNTRPYGYYSLPDPIESPIPT